MQKSEPGSSPIDAPAGKPSHPSRFAISIADPLEDVNRAEKAEGSPAPHKTRVSTETVGSIRERAGEPSKSMIRERAVRVNTRFAAQGEGAVFTASTAPLIQTAPASCENGAPEEHKNSNPYQRLWRTT